MVSSKWPHLNGHATTPSNTGQFVAFLEGNYIQYTGAIILSVKSEFGVNYKSNRERITLKFINK